MINTWFSTILINITFPVWLLRIYLLKKEVSAYTVERKYQQNLKVAGGTSTFYPNRVKSRQEVGFILNPSPARTS
jgi:hypothetical protein